jgi:hypothetical protein
MAITRPLGPDRAAAARENSARLAPTSQTVIPSRTARSTQLKRSALRKLRSGCQKLSAESGVTKTEILP